MQINFLLILYNQKIINRKHHCQNNAKISALKYDNSKFSFFSSANLLSNETIFL